VIGAKAFPFPSFDSASIVTPEPMRAPSLYSRARISTHHADMWRHFIEYIMTENHCYLYSPYLMPVPEHKLEANRWRCRPIYFAASNSVNDRRDPRDDLEKQRGRLWQALQDFEMNLYREVEINTARIILQASRISCRAILSHAERESQRYPALPNADRAERA
jgi:hypothetical protein